jgi:hypothetical protein
MSQLVLSEVTVAAPRPKWAHSLLIPATCAGVSIVLLLLRVSLSTAVVKRLVAKLRGQQVDEDDADSVPQQPVLRQHTGFFPDLRSHINAHGGAIVFAWKVLRLLSCLALTGLTIGAIVSINGGHKITGIGESQLIYSPYLDLDIGALGKSRENKHKKHSRNRYTWFSTAEWIEISLCVFFVRISNLEYSRIYQPLSDLYYAPRRPCTHARSSLPRSG